MFCMSRTTLLPALILLTSAALVAAEDYPLGPDSEPHADVPKGTVTKYTWTSKIFPGTVRDCWVYVPSQYKPDKPACVMIFQDGAGYVQTLYVTVGDTVFRRHMRRKGMLPWTPLKSPLPGL